MNIECGKYKVIKDICLCFGVVKGAKGKNHRSERV